MVNEQNVEFVGEIDDKNKGAFLGGAKALLFPIDWPEPFELVMIEAMACGTPVIALPCGSVPEIITDGAGSWRRSPRAMACLRSAAFVSLSWPAV